MSGHTPRPWIASNDGGETEVVEALSPNGEMVVREICHAFVDDDDRETCLANLRLIAAAPDPLEALEAFLAEHESDGCEGEAHHCGRCVMGRAAIAEARSK